MSSGEQNYLYIFLGRFMLTSPFTVDRVLSPEDLPSGELLRSSPVYRATAGARLLDPENQHQREYEGKLQLSPYINTGGWFTGSQLSIS